MWATNCDNGSRTRYRIHLFDCSLSTFVFYLTNGDVLLHIVIELIIDFASFWGKFLYDIMFRKQKKTPHHFCNKTQFFPQFGDLWEAHMSQVIFELNIYFSWSWKFLNGRSGRTRKPSSLCASMDSSFPFMLMQLLGLANGFIIWPF